MRNVILQEFVALAVPFGAAPPVDRSSDNEHRDQA